MVMLVGVVGLLGVLASCTAQVILFTYRHLICDSGARINKISVKRNPIFKTSASNE